MNNFLSALFTRRCFTITTSCTKNKSSSCSLSYSKHFPPWTPTMTAPFATKGYNCHIFTKRGFKYGLEFEKTSKNDVFFEKENVKDTLDEFLEPGIYKNEYAHQSNHSYENRFENKPKTDPSLNRISPIYSTRKKIALRKLNNSPQLSSSEMEESVAKGMALLKVFSNEETLYTNIYIKGKTFVAGIGDVICCDHLRELEVGDVINLDKISEIGGKLFTIKGNPFIDPKFFTIKGTVLEHLTSNERVYIKRLTKTRRVNHSYVCLTHVRITILKINNPDLVYTEPYGGSLNINV